MAVKICTPRPCGLWHCAATFNIMQRNNEEDHVYWVFRKRLIGHSFYRHLPRKMPPRGTTY
jgi:hypothetical protein